jgi:L-ascorbate metabolism protein UlaG (beta-lactamase superfamily)
LGFPRHFDGVRYFNPGASQVRGFRDFLRWQRTSRPELSPRFVADVVPSVPPRRVEGRGLRATLVNHSTVLLQHAGVNLLTDPIWSDLAGPFPWAGIRRRRNPGVALEHLPAIDIVLLSHNHYDHLDLPTLRHDAIRKSSAFVVPVGVGRLLRSRNLGPVHELDWGDSLAVAGLTVHGVPAFHFSGRGLFDRNRTLWCGYVIESGERLVYFAGDTAFGPHFGWIREKLGPPHLALLPIGAYEPRWFMSSVHMAPQEAVRAHEILGAGVSIGIHHGTFQLADEGLDTPRQLLLSSATRLPFLALANGRSHEIS